MHTIWKTYHAVCISGKKISDGSLSRRSNKRSFHVHATPRHGDPCDRQQGFNPHSALWQRNEASEDFRARRPCLLPSFPGEWLVVQENRLTEFLGVF